MSKTQAKTFAAEWEVIDQLPDTKSGFSATLFKNRQTGEYSFAIRGSTNIVDFTKVGALIANDGIAITQVVDMYNYWQSLNHTGVYNAAKLVYSDAESDMLAALSVDSGTTEGGIAYKAYLAELQRAGAILDSSSFRLRVAYLEFGNSDTLVDNAALQQGTGKLTICPTSLSVEGHSLGGHLAMAFTRLFPTTTANAVSVNGLGFKLASPSVENLFLKLNGAASFDPSRIQNVYGIAGIEFAAMNNWVLQQPGGWDGIFIESSPLDVMGAHSVVQMTDSLAVYQLVSKLDPALTPEKITAFLKASSATAIDSLESALDGLRKIISGSTITPSKTAGSEDSQESREAFYTNLYALQESEVFKTLAGKITLVSSGKDLAAAARTDFSALLSLITLSPVTLRATPGNEATLEDKLKAAWSVEYALWQKDQELSAEQRANGEASFSDEYLKDRNTCLTWLIKVNTQDAPSANGNIVVKDPASGTSDIVNFIDEQSGQRIIVNPAHPTKRQDIYFGGDGDEREKIHTQRNSAHSALAA